MELVRGKRQVIDRCIGQTERDFPTAWTASVWKSSSPSTRDLRTFSTGKSTPVSLLPTLPKPAPSPDKWHLQFVEIEIPIAVHPNKRDRTAAPNELLASPKGCAVFNGCRHDMLPLGSD